mgnify:CR=1 FL=1
MVDPPAVEQGRDRYLTREEIRAIWRALEDEPPVVRGVFRLALLTAQRIGSVCALRWRDIDGAGVWQTGSRCTAARAPNGTWSSASHGS